MGNKCTLRYTVNISDYQLKTILYQLLPSWHWDEERVNELYVNELYGSYYYIDEIADELHKDLLNIYNKCLLHYKGNVNIKQIYSTLTGKLYHSEEEYETLYSVFDPEVVKNITFELSGTQHDDDEYKIRVTYKGVEDVKETERKVKEIEKKDIQRAFELLTKIENSLTKLGY